MGGGAVFGGGSIFGPTGRSSGVPLVVWAGSFNLSGIVLSAAKVAREPTAKTASAMSNEIGKTLVIRINLLQNPRGNKWEKVGKRGLAAFDEPARFQN